MGLTVEEVTDKIYTGKVWGYRWRRQRIRYTQDKCGANGGGGNG